jgi:hypothetical protein
MKTVFLLLATFSAAMTAISVRADDDCHDPVADWQPREVLRQIVEGKGWTVHRIKVDDGCYEVRGVDADGNKVEAYYSPASLRIRKLEIYYVDGQDDDYRGGEHHQREQSRERGDRK